METLLAKGDEAQFLDFINNLGTKLEQTASKPGAPDYTPVEDMSDVGEAGQDFDIASYVSSKY